MIKNQMNERNQFEMLTIEQLVPKSPPVRKLDAAIDFSFVYLLVEKGIERRTLDAFCRHSETIF